MFVCVHQGLRMLVKWGRASGAGMASKAAGQASMASRASMKGRQDKQGMQRKRGKHAQAGRQAGQKARGRWQHCICNVRGLAGAGSTVFVMSEGLRALAALYL